MSRIEPASVTKVAPGQSGGSGLLNGPGGAVEYLRTGTGEPVTVCGHGLAGSIATTRPFTGQVRGERVFLHFRGHGRSAAPDSPWAYPQLADELRAVADHVGATRALGVSMGAGALCRLLEQTPGRFEKAVLVIPAVIDEPRRDAALARLVAMADLTDAHDVEGVAALLAAEQPAGLRRAPLVQRWVHDQARLLVGTPVSRALRSLPHAVAVSDREALRAVECPVLVLGQEDDDAHPASIAEELAGLLPGGRLEMLPPGGIMWSHRARVRELIADFLND